nr:MAG TPA: hypothetical protein [Caudoviricetes sp.]
MSDYEIFRTCDICVNACYVELLDGRSVLVCDGTVTDEPAHEVRETDCCDGFALYVSDEVTNDD